MSARLDTPRTKPRAAYRSKQVYRCQHCGYEGDGWTDGGYTCPRCGGHYDFLEAQDSP